MKKSVLVAIILVIIIFLGFAGYVFVVKKSVNRESIESTPQKIVEAPVQPPSVSSSTVIIDTNDNLDQALQDLDQLNNF
jgi:flagellar basal body-associated protein FliL